VYFGRDDGTLVILLTGSTKHRQQRDIERSEELSVDYGGDASRRCDGGRRAMALTRDFKELVQKRIARDPAFKAILRDYIKATVGFEKLGEAIGTSAKSLVRMLGPRGNHQARHLFAIIGYLQKQAGVEMHVAAGPS